MKRVIWIFGIAVVAGSLVVAGARYRSAQLARSAALELSNDGKRLNAEIDQTRQQLMARAHEEEELRAALRQGQAQKEKLSSALALSSQPASPPRRELADLMQTDPALRSLHKKSYRASVAQRFQRLYENARLSPEQIEKFEELMSEAQQDWLDFRAAAKAQGLATNDPSLAKLRRQEGQKLEAAQKEILGEAGYEEMLRCNRQQPLDNLLKPLAHLLARTDDPLNPAQSDQLLDAFSKASSQYQNGGRADLATLDPQIAFPQAEQILKPAQLAAFRANANVVELNQLRDEYYRQKRNTKE